LKRRRNSSIQAALHAQVSALSCAQGLGSVIFPAWLPQLETFPLSAYEALPFQPETGTQRLSLGGDLEILKCSLGEKMGSTDGCEACAHWDWRTEQSSLIPYYRDIVG
jgi:hypothetical protein